MGHQHDIALPPARLAGVHEVAELLGIGKSALADRRRHPSFPRPIAELRCGPVWDLDQIECYLQARRRDPFDAYRWKWRPERWARDRGERELPELDSDLVDEIARRRRR